MRDDRLTVAAFLDRWLTASLPGHVSEKTFDSYADTVRLHITPSMGRKVLRKLTVSDVDQLLAWKRNAGQAPTPSGSFELYFAGAAERRPAHSVSGSRRILKC